jgi:hypothetical protein
MVNRESLLIAFPLDIADGARTSLFPPLGIKLSLGHIKTTFEVRFPGRKPTFRCCISLAIRLSYSSPIARPVVPNHRGLAALAVRVQTIRRVFLDRESITRLIFRALPARFCHWRSLAPLAFHGRSILGAICVIAFFAPRPASVSFS